MKLIYLDVIRCQFLNLRKALAWISIQILSMARYITQSHYKIHDAIIFGPEFGNIIDAYPVKSYSGIFFLKINTRFSEITHTHICASKYLSLCIVTYASGFWRDLKDL